MDHIPQEARWLRAVNHGIRLNLTAGTQNLVARRYAFSLGGMLRRFDAYDALEREERKIYSKGPEPAPRTKSGEKTISDLLLLYSSLDALAAYRFISADGAELYKKRIREAYEKETRPHELEALFYEITYFINKNIRGEHTLPFNSLQLSEDLAYMRQDADEGLIYGLAILHSVYHDQFEEPGSMLCLGAAKQIANYFNVSDMAQLTRLTGMVEQQQAALERIRLLLLHSYDALKGAIKIMNSRGTFLSVCEKKGRDLFWVESLGRKDLMPIGSLEKGLLGLHFSKHMLSDDEMHAEMILRILSEKFVHTDSYAPKSRDPAHFALFFSSMEAPLLRISNSSARGELIEGWKRSLDKRREALMC